MLRIDTFFPPIVNFQVTSNNHYFWLKPDVSSLRIELERVSVKPLKKFLNFGNFRRTNIVNKDSVAKAILSCEEPLTSRGWAGHFRPSSESKPVIKISSFSSTRVSDEHMNFWYTSILSDFFAPYILEIRLEAGSVLAICLKLWHTTLCDLQGLQALVDCFLKVTKRLDFSQ